MHRQTLMSLFAAAAVAVAMAGLSGASYARAPTGQYGDDPIRGCERAYYACMSLCRDGGLSPEQTARCQARCRDEDASCMAQIGLVRANPRAAANAPNATAQRRE